MGDLQALLEKAEEVGKEQDLEATAKKMLSGRFTLRDMYDQMVAMSKMGPLSKLFEMLPASMTGRMSSDDIESTQVRLKMFRTVMESMTDEEMDNPQIIKSSRVKRIAKGAGVQPKDVKGLLKQYNQSRKAIKGMTSNRKMRRALMKIYVEPPEDGTCWPVACRGPSSYPTTFDGTPSWCSWCWESPTHRRPSGYPAPRSGT
jgi:signal recognition particle subunit SRP54